MGLDVSHIPRDAHDTALVAGKHMNLLGLHPTDLDLVAGGREDGAIRMLSADLVDERGIVEHCPFQSSFGCLVGDRH